MDLISVIVPVYNTEKYLDRCVNSILNQSYSNLEIILVDDGSPDNCAEICDALAQTDERIKVIHQENRGQGLARNAALNVITGKFVTFVDSDDWIGVYHIENLYREITTHNADAALGNHTRVWEDGTTLIRMMPLTMGVYCGQRLTDEIILSLVGTEPDCDRDVKINSSVSMNLYRVDIIEKHDIRFISERYAVGEDFYFNLEYFCNSERLVYSEEKEYYYYQNAESTTKKYNPDRFSRTLNSLSVIETLTKKYGIYDLVEYRVERSFLMKIRVAIRHIVISDLPIERKYDEIDKIISNDIVQKVLNHYPIEKYMFSMRCLMKRMRRKKTKSVYKMIESREKMRDKKGFRTLLKLAGIGR